MTEDKDKGEVEAAPSEVDTLEAKAEELEPVAGELDAPADADAATDADAEPPAEADAPGVPKATEFPHSKPPGERKYYFDHPKNVDKVLRWFFIGCGLLLVADVFVKFFHVPFHHHAAFPEQASFAEGRFERWGFFYAFYGFAACVLLVLAATQLRKVLMRREDYYDAR